MARRQGNPDAIAPRPAQMADTPLGPNSHEGTRPVMGTPILESVGAAPAALLMLARADEVIE